MAAERIVVGASGADDIARRAARQLRDAGSEVVFVGGQQTPAHLVRTAIAEDATRIVVDADQPTVQRIIALCAEWGAAGIAVTDWCDVSNAP